MNHTEIFVGSDRLELFIQRPEERQLPRREPSLHRETTSKSTGKPHSTTHVLYNCSQTLIDQITPNPRPLTSSPNPFSAFFVPETPVQGSSAAASLKWASSVPSRSTLCSPPRGSSQVPLQAQPPVVKNDTFDLSSLPRNITAPPDSLFSSTLIDILIPNSADFLDRSATPQTSAELIS